MNFKMIRIWNIQVANNQSPSPSTTESGRPKLKTQLSTTVSARYDFAQMMPQENLVGLNDVTHGVALFIVHPIEGKECQKSWLQSLKGLNRIS